MIQLRGMLSVEKIAVGQCGLANSKTRHNALFSRGSGDDRIVNGSQFIGEGAHCYCLTILKYTNKKTFYFIIRMLTCINVFVSYLARLMIVLYCWH